jgi:hypothetical protein
VLHRWVRRFAIMPDDKAFFEQEATWATGITQLSDRLLGAIQRPGEGQTIPRWATGAELAQLIEINNGVVRRITAAEAEILGSTARMTRQLSEPSLTEVGAPRGRGASSLLVAPPQAPQMTHSQPEQPTAPRRTNFGPRCYLCGEQCGDEVDRRVISTGSDSRIAVGRSLRVSGGVRQGMRTICGNCAAQLDAPRKKNPLRFLAWLVAAMAIG